MDLILFLLGIPLLLVGRIPVTTKNELPSSIGRALGIIAMMPFTVLFFVSFLSSANIIQPLAPAIKPYLAFGLSGTVLISAVLAALFLKKPIWLVQQPQESTQPLPQSQLPPLPQPSIQASVPVPTAAPSLAGPIYMYRDNTLKIFLTIAAVVAAAVGGIVLYFYLQIPRVSREAAKESKLPSPIQQFQERTEPPPQSQLPPPPQPSIQAPVGVKKSQKPVEKPTDFNVTSIIPAVVQLNCFNSDSSLANLGSGSSFYDQGEHWIMTNAHVVRVDENPPHGCYVYFPTQDGTFYESAYWAGTIYTYDDKIASFDGVQVTGLDYALLKITEVAVSEDGRVFPNPQFRKFPDSFEVKTCKYDRSIEVGEKIFILGYPAIGGENMTITEGIVSGFDGQFKQFAKTSAKVEQGHSGGLAVAAKDGCPIGIPTLAIRGELESIPRILLYWFTDQFTRAIVE